MSTDINRIAELAKEDPKRQFHSIAHLITVAKLEEALRSLRKDASAGIDGVTYEQYEMNVEEKIRQLHQRLKEGKYQAQPLRRVYIPKEDGKPRPISIPALEDKVVQKAVVDLLNAIYEQDFLDCAYGFRPKRSQHQALDKIDRIICTRPIAWVLEIDIRSYFDSIVRSALVGMIEKRVNDGSVLRLIGKWIKVGVIEDGRLLVSETGTGQGQPISPLLANIYLHHLLDKWFESEVKPRLRGEAYEVRFADDAILCFQHKEDAEKVLRVLPKRFEKYGLTLHPEKTRLIEFGRYADKNARKQGKKPATFNFLGFVHICARSRQGEVHSAREDHRQAARSRAEGSLGMVQTAPSRCCERAAESPECQAPRPLPVLRTTDELPRNSAVLSQSRSHLAGVAEPPDTWKAADMGAVCRNATSVPAPTTSDHTRLSGRRESRLKNPLREICTVGSVRGEN